MAIGRHLNDRGHVITRQKDTRSGHMEENRDFINFDECKHPLFTYLLFIYYCLFFIYCSFAETTAFMLIILSFFYLSLCQHAQHTP